VSASGPGTPARGLSQRAARVIGWALAATTALAVLVNQRGVGIARDEVVYVQAGAHYADWWIGLVTLRHGISEASIARGFGGPGPTDNNREHPPLMKTLFGLSGRLLGALGVDEMTAFRAPAAIVHGAAVLLVYGMALELWGLAPAIASALLLLLLPRALFHAGLACFDAPSMALWFATVRAYWCAMDGERPRWPWQVGVAWGLALATKHTALVLPFALGAHYLIVGAAAGRARIREQPALADLAGAARVLAIARTAIGHRWRVIASLAVLGPLTLYALWPWLWLDPVHHVRDWLAFHLGHVHYNFEYLGRNWNAPPFPWHVALVTTLFTVPASTLAAAAVGAGVWIAERGRPRAPALLLALSAAAAFGPFLLRTTPIFGAEKHWMPALPTICIAAGVGAVWAARTAARAIAELARAERVAIAAVAGAVVLAAAVETEVAAPYALTWYSALAGGAPGGADLGMNRQFWGVAMRGALPRLAAEAKPSGPTYVYTHDASPAWALYQRARLVPRTLVDAGWEQAGIERSDLAVVIHELHFNRHDYLIWNSYRTVQPIDVVTSDGVPIVSIYRRSGVVPGAGPGASAPR
jgi:4-amino-4-deoxy-L-arabinose transferase-like glycosyltransferase